MVRRVESPSPITTAVVPTIVPIVPVVIVSNARAVVPTVPAVPAVPVESPITTVSTVSTVSTKSPKIPYDFKGILRYDQQHNVLICLRFKSPIGKLKFHLVGYHTDIEKRTRGRMCQELGTLQSTIRPLDDLPQPDDDLDPVIGLKVIDSNQCRGCPFRSCAKLMYNHVWDLHREFHNQAAQPYVEASTVADLYSHIDPSAVYWITIKAQRWTEKGSTSWRVRVSKDDVATQSESDSPQTSLSWLDQKLQKEKERLERQRGAQSRGTVGNNSDDTSVWLNFTEWP
jgi:hypothetical protein